jgi:hypothetical protein
VHILHSGIPREHLGVGEISTGGLHVQCRGTARHAVPPGNLPPAMMSPNIPAYRLRSPPLREKQPTSNFNQLPIPGHLRTLRTSRPNNVLEEPTSYTDGLGAHWTNLAAPLGCLETVPDFISEFLNLPPQETCESLNSHCTRPSSEGDPSEGVPNSPQSRGTLLESWPSGASLTGLDLTEVVESTGSPVARAMNRSTGEDDPPIE